MSISTQYKCDGCSKTEEIISTLDLPSGWFRLWCGRDGKIRDFCSAKCAIGWLDKGVKDEA